MIDVTKYMVLDKGDCLPSGDILCFAYVDEAHDIFANQICTQHALGGKNCGGLWRGRREV